MHQLMMHSPQVGRVMLRCSQSRRWERAM